MTGALDRWFGVSARGSTVGTEARAGLTTFLTMAYILFVNPQILSKAIDVEGAAAELLTTTALAAAVGTLIMGLVARYPFATAPGMGLNAYFAFTVVLGQGIPWRTALGAVFLNGAVVVLLSLVGLREVLVNAIPESVRAATAAGIGLFLALIGAEGAGLVVHQPATLVTLGNLATPGVLLAVLGFFVTSLLLVLRVRGAILIGILVTSTVAIVSNAPVFDGRAFAGFGEGLVRMPVMPVHIAFQLDLLGATRLGVLGIVFIFLFVDLFDTAGTLIGLSHKAKLLDANGRLPRAQQAFIADALATCSGALLGTSSTTTYIESAAGIQEGGKTGLTSVVVALLFALSVFFWPLAGAVPAAATAPALILIGALMISSVAGLDWDDYLVSIPAFLTLVIMPFTYSIANGISFGIISHAGLHLLSGRGREVHWLLYVLAALLTARYVWLGAG